MANVTTPEFRGCFLQVFRAGKPKNAKAEQLPNYSVRAAFPPETDLRVLKAQAEEAAKQKWPAGIPKTLRSPFRRNDELDNPVPGIPDDWIIMTFARREADGRPSVFDQQVRDIEPVNQSEVYAGAWYQASVNAYPYDNSGNKGVAFGLQGIQKRRDDTPLSGKPSVARADDFSPAAASGSSSGGGIFD